MVAWRVGMLNCLMNCGNGPNCRQVVEFRCIGIYELGKIHVLLLLPEAEMCSKESIVAPGFSPVMLEKHNMIYNLSNCELSIECTRMYIPYLCFSQGHSSPLTGPTAKSQII
jgi:hypothetical protein